MAEDEGSLAACAFPSFFSPPEDTALNTRLWTLDRPPRAGPIHGNIDKFIRLLESVGRWLLSIQVYRALTTCVP